MTSSFGTVVGTPRDQLPDISKTNYLQTDADMTEATNNAIDDAKADSEEFYQQMVRIRELQQRNFDDNLQGLVNFSKSAAQFVEARKAGEEARELNRLAKDELETLRKKYTDAEGNFNIKDADFTKELLEKIDKDKFNGALAKNLFKVRSGDNASELTIRQLKQELKEKGFNAFNKFLTENNFLLLDDQDAALSLYDSVEDVFLSKMILQAKAYGMSDKEFDRFYIKTLAPEMRRRKQSKMQRWESVSDSRAESNHNKKIRSRIVEVIQTRKKPGEDGEDIIPNIDGTDGLIEYVQKEKGFKTKLEAQNYVFSEVASMVSSGENGMDDTDAEYLLNEALFTHSDGSGTTTYANSNFKSTRANSRNLQNAIESFRRDPDKDKESAKNKFNETMDEVFNQYDGNPPSGVVFELMGQWKDIPELKGEDFPEKIKAALSREQTGANFGDHPSAGKSQSEIYRARLDMEEAMKVLAGRAVGKETAKLTQPMKFEIDAAVGDLRAKVKAETDGTNVSEGEAVRKFLPDVIKKLEKGGYKDFYKSKILTTATDYHNDRIDLINDKSLVNNSQFNSVYEKEALRQMNRFLQSGGPMPEYFDEVIKSVKIRQEDGTFMNGIEYAIERLKATGGMDKDTGLLTYKEDYAELTPEDYAEVGQGGTSNQTKTYNFIEKDRESATKMLNGFAKERQRQSILKRHRTKLSDEENDNFFKKPTDRITGVLISNNLTDYNVETVYKMAKQGYTDFGRYGFTAEEIIDVVDNSDGLAGMAKERFTEDYQTFMMLALIRRRANRSNDIGGAQTEEKNWRRLVNLSPKEQDAVLATFPKLKDMPMSQFQNLQADVAGLILTEAEQRQAQRAEKRAAKEAERKKRQEEKAKANEGLNRLRQRKKND